MRIIETFICFYPITNEYVKVHRGRYPSGSYKYFMEYRSGRIMSIRAITEREFEEIKDN